MITDVLLDRAVRARTAGLRRCQLSVVLGAVDWDHMPVFVVTHRAHEPIVKEGGTTYHFVTTGLADALDRAGAAAGEKDIAIGGGANIAQQCRAAGMVEEIRLHLVPVLLGAGVRLFEHLGPTTPSLAANGVVDAGEVTHLRYRIRTEP